MTLTPEEQEALRKREETKDRLHRNYLRRKENGKQREYEERTKATKKAEMDAKKSHESRGYFQRRVYFCKRLAKNEPVKAERTA